MSYWVKQYGITGYVGDSIRFITNGIKARHGVHDCEEQYQRDTPLVLLEQYSPNLKYP